MSAFDLFLQFLTLFQIYFVEQEPAQDLYKYWIASQKSRLDFDQAAQQRGDFRKFQLHQTELLQPVLFRL